MADKAFEKGDYIVSNLSYQQALNKLRKYQGNKMHPILLAGTLKEKLQKTEEHLKNTNENIRLTFNNWKLSKTSFLKGKQCTKYLYLDKYKKKEKTPPSAKKLKIFAAGHKFEDKFRYSEFPNGINIKDVLGKNIGYYNSYTKHLLVSKQECELFEGGIIEDEILILIDVIRKNKNGLYDFYEVKLHSKINEVIWQDLALQYYVCKKRFQNYISSFNIVTRIGISDWEVKDVKSELEARISVIQEDIIKFKSVLELQAEPEIEIGEQCTNPYECEFIDYCQRSCKS